MTRREFLKNALTMAALAPLGRVNAEGLVKALDKRPVKANGPQVARRPFRETALTLPLLGFGNMRLPVQNGQIDYATAKQMYARAFEAGVNYFDTAYMYHAGQSESYVGEALSAYPRDSYYLADKMPVFMVRGGAAGVKRIFEEQLKKCRVDYFDFYLLHNLNASSWPLVQKYDALNYLIEQKKAGRIRYLGFSFHDSPALLAKIIPAYPWDFAQIQLNYQDWTDYRSKEQYEMLTDAKIPVIVMEPLRGGQLATLNPAAVKVLQEAHPEDSPAKWAFRYLAGLPNVVCILSGMSEPKVLEENIRTFADIQPLNPAEQKVLANALKLYRSGGEIPCTGCRYCLPCPADVAIPDVFAIYNKWKATGNRFQRDTQYNALGEDARASSCVHCNACLKKCPQHLPIPNLLAKVAKEIEGK